MCCAACCTLFIGLSSVSSSAGLISYFDFEGDAVDQVGGNNGVVNGATLTSGYNGGQAYLFDGINDYISVALNINPSALLQLTMGAWVKSVGTYNGREQIISHDSGGYDRSLGIDSSKWASFSGSGAVLNGPAIDTSWTFRAAIYDQSSGTVGLL